MDNITSPSTSFSTPHKRQRTDNLVSSLEHDKMDTSQVSIEESSSNSRCSAPKFVVLKMLDGDIQKLSPFLISKGIAGVCGTVPKISKPRAGGLLVECSSAAQSRQLLSCKKLGEYNVSAEPHKTLNYCKGVVFSRDLIEVGDAAILEELKSQHVLDVHRITTKRDGVTVPTGSLVLTFDSPCLPQSIKAGYLHLKVRAYIPSPMRCFKCQHFGHTSTSCKSQAKCANCGESAHDPQETCTSQPKCVNCKGDHPASNKSCPKWKEERRIQEIKVKDGISYAEARKRCKAVPSQTASYAQVAAAPGAQTSRQHAEERMDKLEAKLDTLLSTVAHLAQLVEKLLTSKSPTTAELSVASSAEPASTRDCNGGQENAALSVGDKAKLSSRRSVSGHSDGHRSKSTSRESLTQNLVPKKSVVNQTPRVRINLDRGGSSSSNAPVKHKPNR